MPVQPMHTRQFSPRMPPTVWPASVSVQPSRPSVTKTVQSRLSRQLSPTVRTSLQASSLKAKKYDDATAAALESNKYGESAKAYQIAGTAASNGGKTKLAIEYFEKYIELAPTAKNSGDILFSIAGSYQQLKDTAKAKEYYQKAIAEPGKINPKNLEAAKAQLAAIK